MGTQFSNLVELYESSVNRYSDNPLFGTRHTEGWRWMPYSDFGKQVDYARGGLAGLGVHGGEVEGQRHGITPGPWVLTPISFVPE